MKGSARKKQAIECQACGLVLRDPHDVFCDCVFDCLEQMQTRHIQRHYKSGDIVVMAGYPPPFFGSIRKGAASVDISLSDGRLQGVSLFLPPDAIGNTRSRVSRYTVTALSDLELYCIEPRTFEQLMDRLPHLRLRFLSMKLDALDRARSWLMVLGRKTASERLAYFIVRVAQKSGISAPLGETAMIEVDMPVTREGMARFLGLTTETVSRELSQLEKQGIICARRSRHITVNDYRQLEIMAGIDDDGAVIS